MPKENRRQEVAAAARRPSRVRGLGSKLRPRSRRDLLVNSLLAATLAFSSCSLLVTASWRNFALVLINLPFAFVGGVFAVACHRRMLSLGSMVGFVTLFGITLRNSMLMISHYEHLVVFEDRAWGFETAIQGAADRLIPILMTSLVTGLGLLPLALGVGEPGREIEGPMAIAILGGLSTSMALNFASFRPLPCAMRVLISLSRTHGARREMASSS